MSCETDYSKMTDLTNMGDLCCLSKVLSDFRCSMKIENKCIVEAIDKLIGQVCDDQYGGSLGALVKVLKQHKQLLCTLNKECEDDCDYKYENDKKCCLSLCNCFDDDECCPSCRPTLLDLLDDFKRMHDSHNLIFTFHKDLTFLLEAIFHYYCKKGEKQPCLPQCDEMFRYIMYLVKLCLSEKCCKRDKKEECVCKVCKPDPKTYPIVILIFLSLYFGNKLQKYVELYCCCCVNKGLGTCEKGQCETVSVSFCKNKFDDVKNCSDCVCGVIKCVEIFDSCNECIGHTDLTVTGTTCSNDDKHTFTANASGVVKHKDCIVGTVTGTVFGTLCDCHATGILTGFLIELKAKDPCKTARNPYNDAQKGILAIFRLLDKINIEKMLEILGDNMGSLTKRLLVSSKDKFEEDCHVQYKDHSKKYKCVKKC